MAFARHTGSNEAASAGLRLGTLRDETRGLLAGARVAEGMRQGSRDAAQPGVRHDEGDVREDDLVGDETADEHLSRSWDLSRIHGSAEGEQHPRRKLGELLDEGWQDRALVLLRGAETGQDPGSPVSTSASSPAAASAHGELSTSGSVTGPT